jgi:hypothetical protein
MIRFPLNWPERQGSTDREEQERMIVNRKPLYTVAAAGARLRHSRLIALRPSNVGVPCEVREDLPRHTPHTPMRHHEIP